MKFLLYCIFCSESPPSRVVTEGIGGRPVQFITQNGLSGAYSVHEHRPPASERSALITYKQVVESFHRDRTVIPMRFGAVFDEVDQIGRILVKRGETFRRLLAQLDGCAEMGVRIFLFEAGSTAEGSRAKGVENEAESPGKAYLNKRQALYNEEAQAIRQMKALAAECRKIFQGFFKAYREEFSRPGITGTIRSVSAGGEDLLQGGPSKGLISLYFLIPRHSVEPFVERFHKISRAGSERFLLSGPWPPYNFAALQEGQTLNCRRATHS